MVNLTQRDSIPFQGGRGYICKPKGNYLPGEFSLLNNVEFNDQGYLQNRPVLNTWTSVEEATGTSFIENPREIIGEHGIGIVVTYGGGGQYYYAVATGAPVEPARYVLGWGESDLPVNAAPGSFHKIVQYFMYNNTGYWLTWEFNGSTELSTYHLYTVSYGVDPFDIIDVEFADLTDNVLFTAPFGDIARYRNAFIFKDRLWIATDSRLYFSGATLLTEYTVPEGGFFAFPDGRDITWCVAVRDSVYIIRKGSIYLLSYTTDPNTDSSLRPVTSELGGTHACVYNDTVYFVAPHAIFSITNMSVSKFMDLSDLDGGFRRGNYQLTPWLDRLFVINSHPIQYDALTNIQAPIYEYELGRVYKPYQVDESWGGLYIPTSSPDPVFKTIGDQIEIFNYFSINMQTGQVAVYDVKDCLDFDPVNNSSERFGYCVQAWSISSFNLGTSFPVVLLFTSLKQDGTTPPNSAFGTMYYMDNLEPTFIRDRLATGTLIPPWGNIYEIGQYRPNYRVEIQYTPDGFEYESKRFRFVDAMGEIPFEEFELVATFDNEKDNKFSYQIPIKSTINESGSIINDGLRPRPHYPIRVAINQRARSLTLQFRCSNPKEPMIDDANYSQFQLSDISVLWTPTKRPNRYRTPTYTT